MAPHGAERLVVQRIASVARQQLPFAWGLHHRRGAGGGAARADGSRHGEIEIDTPRNPLAKALTSLRPPVPPAPPPTPLSLRPPRAQVGGPTPMAWNSTGPAFEAMRLFSVFSPARAARRSGQKSTAFRQGREGERLPRSGTAMAAYLAGDARQ